MRPVWTIFYQYDPWQASIGGIQSVVSAFLRYAPDAFEMRLVGTAACPDSAVGQWQLRDLAGRPVWFLPLFVSGDDNVRRRIPTTVRYTAALAGRRLDSDFLHFHRLEPSLMARRWRGEKTLFVHNDVRAQMGESAAATGWGRVPGVYFALEERLMAGFDRILSCNSEAADFYRGRYPHLAARIATYRNMVDNDLFVPKTPATARSEQQALAARLGVSPQSRFVLFAGRLHAQKDPLLLLAAFERLQMPDVHLLIAGAGELEPQVRAAAGRLPGRVHLRGPVPRLELAQLMRASAALVLSSAYEGLPMVVLEALASGTPVVSTPCGETPRLLSPGSGCLSRDFTPDALAEALRAVLNDPAAFGIDRCVEAARPFAARTIVGDLAAQMLERWRPLTPRPPLLR